MLLIVFLISGIVLLSSQEQPDNCTSNGIPSDACQLPPIVFISVATIDGSNCDGSFPSADFNVAPRILYDDAEESSYYTFAFIGPGPFLNWLVVNIPDCAFFNGTLASFTQVANYLPPITFIGIDFVFDALVYRQTQMLSVEGFSIFERFFFNMGNFAQTNHLCGPTLNQFLEFMKSTEEN